MCLASCFIRTSQEIDEVFLLNWEKFLSVFERACHILNHFIVTSFASLQPLQNCTINVDNKTVCIEGLGLSQTQYNLLYTAYAFMWVFYHSLKLANFLFFHIFQFIL